MNFNEIAEIAANNLRNDKELLAELFCLNELSSYAGFQAAEYEARVFRNIGNSDKLSAQEIIDSVDFSKVSLTPNDVKLLFASMNILSTATAIQDSVFTSILNNRPIKAAAVVENLSWLLGLIAFQAELCGFAGIEDLISNSSLASPKQDTDEEKVESSASEVIPTVETSDSDFTADKEIVEETPIPEEEPEESTDTEVSGWRDFIDMESLTSTEKQDFLRFAKPLGVTSRSPLSKLQETYSKWTENG